MILFFNKYQNSRKRLKKECRMLISVQITQKYEKMILITRCFSNFNMHLWMNIQSTRPTFPCWPDLNPIIEPECVLSSTQSQLEIPLLWPERWWGFNPYPTAFPYGNGMVLHFYQQQESSTTKTVHKVINKGLKAYV